MRAYYFGNMYLASIQQGIQALHCTSALYLKYTGVPAHISTPDFEKKQDDLYDWGRNHKTVVVLNGGESEDIQVIKTIMGKVANPYAWADWHESAEALNESLTCVGIILPARIYDSAKELRRPPRYRDKSKVATDLSEWEIELIEAMNGCQLAR